MVGTHPIFDDCIIASRSPRLGIPDESFGGQKEEPKNLEGSMTDWGLMIFDDFCISYWYVIHLVGGWTNSSEKYARQNGNLPPNLQGEKTKCLSCHHLDMSWSWLPDTPRFFQWWKFRSLIGAKSQWDFIPVFQRYSSTYLEDHPI